MTMKRGAAILYGLILLLIGVALAVPGFKLVSLGGSLYYVVAGVATTVAGVMILWGKWWGAPLYCAVILGTIIWALWEVGVDGWQLMPRVVAPVVLGIPLFIAMALRRSSVKATVIGCVAVGLAVFAGIFALSERPHEPSSRDVNMAAASVPDIDWPHYGFGQGGARHSPAAQITPANVGALELAWSTHIVQPMNGLQKARFSGTPLKVGEMLYMCTGLNDIVALDATTGAIRWRHDSRVDARGVASGNCRGLAHYRAPDAKGTCASSIYTATVDARLIAVDAFTGRPCPRFGQNGAISLLKGMGEKRKGYYYVTSPPQLVRGKLIIGGYVADGQHLGEPSGAVRAFDAITGQFAWAWDMGNPKFHGEPPEGQTYTLGTPNSWAPMSADEKLGIVYVPTGNATPDYFGAYRTPAMEKYTASLVAIDAETGAEKWHFQTVHHDVWDYDISVQPALIDLPTSREMIPAVAQATKHGQLFILDRRTGKPIFPVTERPVPQGAVKGDWVSPTQPHSSLPNFTGPILTEKDMWGATPLDQLWCRIAFRESRYEGPFTPITTQHTIVHPGFSGGTEWGSATYDPQRRLLLFITNYIVNRNRLVPRAEMNAAGVYPAKDPQTINWGLVPQGGVPYGAETVPFQAPTGTPCQKPPYSTLTALDPTTGKIVWSRPLGTAKGIGPFGMKSYLPTTIGTPAFGGSITTAGGVTFVGASLDSTLRAFDTRTGKLLWTGRLPSDGLSTPLTYTAKDGRQFVVIAAGDTDGGGVKTSAAEEAKVQVTKTSTAGGTLVAFALPRR